MIEIFLIDPDIESTFKQCIKEQTKARLMAVNQNKVHDARQEVDFQFSNYPRLN